MMAQTSGFIATTVHALGDADGASVGALVGEFRRILNEQNRPFISIVACACSKEMPAQNLRLVNPGVGEETVGRLGCVSKVVENLQRRLPSGMICA